MESQMEPWELEGSSVGGDTAFESTGDTQTWASSNWSATATHDTRDGLESYIEPNGERLTMNSNLSATNWSSAATFNTQERSEPGKERKERRQSRPLHESMKDMDQIGSADIVDSISGSIDDARTRANRRADSRTSGDISLWHTFKELYKQNPKIKYFVVALFLLLLVSLILVGVSLSNRKTKQDCNSANYKSDPFILLPQSSKNLKSGEFGTSLDASSNMLVVGDPNPLCVELAEEDCSKFTVGGAVYVYEKRNNKNEPWSLYSQFVLDDSISSGDNFGTSVSISEDSKTIVVGSPFDDGLGITAGAIYVMEAPFDKALYPLKLLSNDIGANDEFGGSVGVSVTNLPSATSDSPVKVTNVVAGAASDDDFGANSGGVYVFSKFEGIPIEGTCGGQNITVNEWIQCQKLLPDDGGTFDRFGRAVHIADRTIVVGTDWDDDMGIDAGAAYVYSLGDDGNWGLQQKLLPPNSDSTANKFGNAVATSGNLIIVGADLDDSQGVDSGAAYVYKLSGGVWNLDSRLITIDDNPIHDGYNCGSSVDISSDGNAIAVGCRKGGVVFVFTLEKVWVQKAYFRYQDFYSKKTALLGESVSAQPGNNGMIVTGQGVNGEVFSYSKDC